MSNLVRVPFVSSRNRLRKTVYASSLVALNLPRLDRELNVSRVSQFYETLSTRIIAKRTRLVFYKQYCASFTANQSNGALIISISRRPKRFMQTSNGNKNK